MGKTSMALAMASAAAKEDGKPVAIFSLEMTNEELVTRLLCAESRINSQNLRRGNIKDPEWEKISTGMSALSQLPIYIDDSGSVSVTEIRSRCRRVQSADGLAAIFIDYLQLVRPSGTSRSQNRNEELSEICRVLKATAKDLEVPIIALAQLNRGVESRNDKRPMLADLRDCLAGDALVANADTGERIPVAEIVQRGLRFNVWSLDDQLKLVRRPIVDSWEVGAKEIYRVTTQSGRVLRCSDGHRFLTISGWRPLRDLQLGVQVAAPRVLDPQLNDPGSFTAGRALLLGWLIGDAHLGGSAALTVVDAVEADVAAALGAAEFGLSPKIRRERANTTAMRVSFTTGRMSGAGKNPLTTWLRQLGVWKVTGHRKRAPKAIFEQQSPIVAAFLRGLFHADGSLTRSAVSTRVSVRLTTISEGLARDVQHLLLRFGIVSIVKSDARNIGGYRTKSTAIWTIAIQQRAAVCDFMDQIGFLGEKHERAMRSVVREVQTDAAHFDRIPLEVNERVLTLRHEHGFSHAALGWREQGKAMSRTTCAKLATRLGDEVLETLAFSDVIWEPIVSIERDGLETVYDLTIDGLHNFCVNEVITHNSGALEQEADIVSFLYRDSYYNRESAPEPDMTEFIIAKNRSGPTGMVKLRFLAEHTLFVPYGDASHYSGP
jgi:replicative DNA helicase